MAKITDDMDTGKALLGLPHPLTKSINIIMGMRRTQIPNERRIGFFCVKPSVMSERPIGITGHRSRYRLLIIKMHTKMWYWSLFPRVKMYLSPSVIFSVTRRDSAHLVLVWHRQCKLPWRFEGYIVRWGLECLQESL